MATERLPRRKVREILRLETTRRAKAARLTWPEVERVDEAELERRLYPPAAASRRAAGEARPALHPRPVAPSRGTA
jgi:hypothetical protein